jgi:hypothetical protein
MWRHSVGVRDGKTAATCREDVYRVRVMIDPGATTVA